MIPRKIHQVWVGGPVPDHLAELMATWRELHPSWDYQLWTDAEVAAERWELGHLYAQAERYAPRFQGQFKADLLRYEILSRWGGVYLDADFEAVKPLDSIVDHVPAFAAWEQEPHSGEPAHGWVNNAVMGAPPGHRWLSILMEGLGPHLVELHARGVRRPNMLTGPQYLTPRTLPLLPGGSTPASQHVVVLPKSLFYPYLWSELHRGRDEFPNAYAVHHWENRRQGRGVPR